MRHVTINLKTLPFQKNPSRTIHQSDFVGAERVSIIVLDRDFSIIRPVRRYTANTTGGHGQCDFKKI